MEDEINIFLSEEHDLICEILKDCGTERFMNVLYDCDVVQKFFDKLQDEYGMDIDMNLDDDIEEMFSNTVHSYISNAKVILT
tara:strand:- start:1364 stop:1609 length:246 start_codon:yes stop_codon:yes gene_type:complete